MAEPPLLDGGEKLTVACALAPVAVPMIGAPGRVTGVTAFEAAEAGPVSGTELVAVTVNVYVAPLVKPVIVMGDPAPVAVRVPGLEVTVEPVIGTPPVFVGGVKGTI